VGELVCIGWKHVVGDKEEKKSGTGPGRREMLRVLGCSGGNKVGALLRALRMDLHDPVARLSF
jgi:hypothetical protein